MAKKSKEEKEQEFIESAERLLGFPLLSWQKPLLLEIRARSLSGRDMSGLDLRPPRKKNDGSQS